MITQLPRSILCDLQNRGLEIKSSEFVNGGDINEARKITITNGEVYFLKYNDTETACDNLSAEKKGLELLQCNQSTVPKLIASQVTNRPAYLVLEWIDPHHRYEQLFAEHLANLHHHANDRFGLDHNNYIGSLTQKNGRYTSFSDFYISCRIVPQIKMANDNGFTLKFSEERFEQVINNEIPIEQPTLIHGDLWSGNVIDGVDGPVFIDPSVSYSHREMDLSMMQLFGGFSDNLFDMYDEIFPISGHWRQRSDLFQLYYLLVHLNIFGRSYLPQVQSILDGYL